MWRTSELSPSTCYRLDRVPEEGIPCLAQTRFGRVALDSEGRRCSGSARRRCWRAGKPPRRRSLPGKSSRGFGQLWAVSAAPLPLEANLEKARAGNPKEVLLSLGFGQDCFTLFVSRSCTGLVNWLASDKSGSESNGTEWRQKKEVTSYLTYMLSWGDHPIRLDLLLWSPFSCRLALFDTLDFLLNEYFIELNTANFNILNKFLNWILSKKITNE